MPLLLLSLFPVHCLCSPIVLASVPHQRQRKLLWLLFISVCLLLLQNSNTNRHIIVSASDNYNECIFEISWADRGYKLDLSSLQTAEIVSMYNDLSMKYTVCCDCQYDNHHNNNAMLLEYNRGQQSGGNPWAFWKGVNGDVVYPSYDHSNKTWTFAYDMYDERGVAHSHASIVWLCDKSIKWFETKSMTIHDPHPSNFNASRNLTWIIASKHACTNAESKGGGNGFKSSDVIYIAVAIGASFLLILIALVSILVYHQIQNKDQRRYKDMDDETRRNTQRNASPGRSIVFQGR